MIALRKNGFTLLEVMVAMAILAISVTTLLIIRNDSIEQAVRSKEIRRLKTLLEEKIGEIATGVQPLKGQSYGDFQSRDEKDESLQNYIWTAKSEPVKLESPPDTFGKTYSIMLKKVHLEVRTRSESSRNHSISLDVYFLEEPSEEAPEEGKKSEIPNE